MIFIKTFTLGPLVFQLEAFITFEFTAFTDFTEKVSYFRLKLRGIYVTSQVVHQNRK